MRSHTFYQATGCQTSREEGGPRQPSRREESRVCYALLKRNGQFSRCGRLVYPYDPGWNDYQCPRCLGIHRNHRQATPPMDSNESWPAQFASSERSARPEEVSRISISDLCMIRRQTKTDADASPGSTSIDIILMVDLSCVFWS